MENYHEVENGMEADADDARSEAEDQVLFYEKRILALRREVEHLKRRLEDEFADRGRSKAAFD